MGRDFVPGTRVPIARGYPGNLYHSILGMSTVIKNNPSVCPWHTFAWKGYENVEMFVF